MPTLTGDVVLKVIFMIFFFKSLVNIFIMTYFIINYEIKFDFLICMQVRAGTQPGQKVVLKGKGIHSHCHVYQRYY